MKRAIVLFPKFHNIDAIQAARERFDPLANYIAPHITLVFPFECALSAEELRAHLHTALAGAKKFNVRLSGVTGDVRDGYLFLNVKQGNDEIIDLHDRLYSGALESFLYRKVTYCPHVTVGRIEQQDAFDLAVIFEKPCGLQSIQQDFSANVVQIPATPVRRIEFRM